MNSSRLSLTLALTVLSLLSIPHAADAAVTHQVDAAVLYVSVTDASDVAITCSAGTVRLNATNTGAQCSALQGIQVGGGDGDNTIDLDGVGAPAFDPAKFTGYIYIYGGAGADDISGSAFADYIFGGAHDDTLKGKGSPQGDMQDVIVPESGNDTILGDSAGYERVSFQGSNLTLKNTTYAAELSTQEAGEVDTFINVDDVWLTGTNGEDSIDARLYSRTGLTVDGDFGDDELWGPADVPAGTAAYIQGGSSNDTIHGGAASEFLSGGHGDDTIDGGGGDDELDGQFGNDTLAGGIGTDTIGARINGHHVKLGAGTLVLGSSDDGTDAIAGDIEVARFEGDYNSDDEIDASGWPGKLVANLAGGNDVVTGGTGVNEIHGGADNDRIVGGPANDRLYGDDGKDLLDGAAGADEYYGGEGEDDLRTIDGLAEAGIACGGGADVLYSDPGDASDGSCEAIAHELPKPPGPAVPSGPTPPSNNPGTPPIGTPPPMQPPIAKLVLGQSKLSRKGVFTTRLRCPADEVVCRVDATLVSAARIGRKKVKFGSYSEIVFSGVSTTLSVKLSKRSLKLLRSRGRIKAHLTLRVRDGDDNRSTIKRSVVLKLPRS
jgi:Ca2+-binding RTX toxin-like protein